MKSPIRVLPRTYHEGVSFAQEPADLLATSANAALLQLVAQRAVRLENARVAAAATLITAEDPAQGPVQYQRGALGGHWHLNAIYYECTHRRAPKATMVTREGPTFELTIDVAASSWGCDTVENAAP